MARNIITENTYYIPANYGGNSDLIRRVVETAVLGALNAAFIIFQKWITKMYRDACQTC